MIKFLKNLVNKSRNISWEEWKIVFSIIFMFWCLSIFPTHVTYSFFEGKEPQKRNEEDLKKDEETIKATIKRDQIVSSYGRLFRTSFDGHLFITNGNFSHFIHHPGCRCGKR